MSIEFDDTKCWLTDQSDLHVKRYLSQTRTFFREGAWIRDYFKEFFPAVEADNQGELFFDLSSLEPECVFTAQGTLSTSKIPKEVVDQFMEAIEQYDARLEKGPLNFNEEISSQGFELPDPKLHPDLYVVVETKKGFRLIILWGLESDKKNGNLPISEVAEVLDKYIGKPSLKAVAQTSKKEEEEPKESIPEPSPAQSEVSHTPTVTIIPEKPEETPAPEAEPEEPFIKQTTVVPVVEEKPIVEEKPVIEKAPPPQKKEQPKKEKIKKEKIPAEPKEPFDWNRFKWLMKVGIAAVVVLVLLVVVAKISVSFLGPKLVTAEIASPTGKRSLGLQQGNELLLPNGTIVTADESNAKVLLSEFPKPGNYRFITRPKGSEDIGNQIQILYSNARNDLVETPVASLRIDRQCVHPGDVVTASVYQSFHENASYASMDHLISWGGSDDMFQPIENPNEPLTHTYSEVGEYMVSLWVRDDENHQDFDMINVKVVAPEESLENEIAYPPVPDAEILAIRSSDKGYLVDLGIEGSHDLDNSISTIAVDWGDGNPVENFVPGTQVAQHLYANTAGVTMIRVTATDESGLNSVDSAELALDFKSSEINNKARFGNEVESLVFHNTLIASESGDFSMTKAVCDELVKNKKRIRFTLGNPASDPTLPLIDVRWTIRGPNGLAATVTDARTVEILAVDGSYQIKVSAKSPTGDTYELDHQLIIRAKSQYSFPVKVASWFAKNLSALSF